ncbi:MAG TPA: SgcJ/EcaC family oxidoreductase [Tepidisphaeraceae bacterium]|nr:SgcJ/EcaC family oxidoreductase [Tepidisphaeraceae bacterium]
MRWLIVCAVLTFGLAPALADDAPAQTPEQAIKQGVKDLEAAWARHDAKALAELYSPNAEIVTESGQTLAGRDGIQEALTQAFSDTLKDSTLSETVDKVRFIKRDVAIVDADALVKSGDTEINKMHLVSVIVKQNGKWLIETTRAIVYKQQ